MKHILILLFVLLVSCYNVENTNNNGDNEVTGKNDKEQVQNLLTSALKHQEEDNYKMAAKDFKEALKIKEDATIRVSLGSAFIMACDFENAIKNFKIAVNNKENLDFNDYLIAMLGIINGENMLDRYQEAFDTSVMLQNEVSFSDIPDEKKLIPLFVLQKQSVE